MPNTSDRCAVPILHGALALLLLMAMPSARAAYDVSGVVVHQCSCAYACPCMFENGPDDCALAAVYHFDAGHYNNVSVAGLSMISVDGAVGAHPIRGQKGGACCRAKNAETNSPAGVVYLDAAATPAQRQVLLALLQAHGEWPGPGRPVRSVPIQFAKRPDGYDVLVPGRFQGRARQVFSRKGAPLTVDGVGFAEGPRWTVGRSVVNDLHDPDVGLNWHLPGTNGSWSLLHWTQRGAETGAVIGERTVARSSH